MELRSRLLVGDIYLDAHGHCRVTSPPQKRKEQRICRPEQRPVLPLQVCRSLAGGQGVQIRVWQEAVLTGWHEQDELGKKGT